jgi:hypothetical protein
MLTARACVHHAGEEAIGGRQLRDLNRARAFLADIVQRSPRAKLFGTVQEALDYIKGSAGDCLRCGHK